MDTTTLIEAILSPAIILGGTFGIFAGIYWLIGGFRKPKTYHPTEENARKMIAQHPEKGWTVEQLTGKPYAKPHGQ